MLFNDARGLDTTPIIIPIFAHASLNATVRPATVAIIGVERTIPSTMMPIIKYIDEYQAMKS